MHFIENKIKDTGKWIEELNIATVTEMYQAAESHFGFRTDQSWQIAVAIVRKKEQEERKKSDPIATLTV